MRIYKTEAIVLKRRNAAEADRLLTVFTKDRGKLQIKAIGVRKITSRRASHVEPLNHVFLTVHEGRGMPILTEAVVLEAFSTLKGNLGKVGLAYHICEIIDALCAENQEHTNVFHLLKNILSAISEKGKTVQKMYDFEMSLLHELGFYPKTQPDEKFNPSHFIESILERKLKARPLIHKFH